MQRSTSNDHKHTTSVSLITHRAYASLPKHLRKLTMETALSLSSEIVLVTLRADLVQRIGQRRRRNKHGSGGESEIESARSRNGLRPLLHGLARTSGIKEGIFRGEKSCWVKCGMLLNWAYLRSMPTTGTERWARTRTRPPSQSKYPNSESVLFTKHPQD
ncbi:hypothetical protein Hypma_008297 [Hypsizygus marmoreus]|uniref:Uncharacterized protein n=1 Tax=Hypsizygus marmoreus TaxID=39966 RepID=A0A369JTD9_HYPMA|nr:hypothetical protein Hypma_008297 [Hypsizygus marmoreus]